MDNAFHFSDALTLVALNQHSEVDLLTCDYII